jgi:hypothetical protein
MPVERAGRFVEAYTESLTRWLGSQTLASEPLHIAHKSERDLGEDLKHGLADAQKRSHKRRANEEITVDNSCAC